MTSDQTPDRPAASCPAEAEGKPCQKYLYRASNGEDWDHAGGHWFATDATHDRIARGHFDAGALLAGEPVTIHMPEECPGPERCMTARVNNIGIGTRP